VTDAPWPPIARDPAELPGRASALAMSGLEFMQAMLAGAIPHPPIAGLMCYRLVRVGDGEVAFRATPGADHLNPMGGVHGGWYGTVLDSALGCAVMTRMPRGHWYVTLEYKVNLTRAVPPGMEVEAVGRAVHVGRTTGVAEAVLRGVDDGRVYAAGSTTCLIQPG